MRTIDSARASRSRPSAVLLACLGTAAILASCSTDAPTAPQGEQVSGQVSIDQESEAPISVCHGSGSAGAVIDVSSSQLASHLSHGDYIAHLVVNHNAGQTEDGVHFHRIGDAIGAARAGRLARGERRSAACRILITVADGVFRGSALRPAGHNLDHFPLVIDVPDITLRGALVMRLDARGRATGNGVDHRRTTLSPVEPLPVEDFSTPLIIANGHPGGSAGNGLTVEGFVLQSGQDAAGVGGQGVFGIRVRGLRIRGNRFEAGFSESIDLRATSAVIEQNHLGGTGGTCDICLAGPGVYRATGNRLLAGGIPGFLTTPAVDLPIPNVVEPYDLPVASEVSGEITNNEVRDHLRLPVGVGIRVGAIGPGAPDVRGSSHFTIRDNLLVNNRFAMIIEAAFPVPETELKSDIDVTLGGNVMRQSCQNNLLVALTRHTAALGLTDFPYLENSTYRLALGGDIQWKDVWFGHEKGHGNTLVVDGRRIPNGVRQFYDPETCPGTTGSPSSVALSAMRAR